MKQPTTSPDMLPKGLLVTSTDGTKIWAEAAGNETQPAVIFIHGFGFAALAFDKQFEDPRLLKNLHLIRYDMRGHGRSDKPEGPEAYGSARFADDFGAVCRAFGVEKPFVLGWSLGGGVIVDVLEAWGAEFIRGVLYCGGTVLTRLLHTECATPFVLDLIPGLLSEDGNVLTRAAIDFVHGCVPSSGSHLPFETKIKWIGALSVMPPTVRMLTLMRVQPTEKWEKEIKRLPVMIVHGDQDSMVETEKLLEVSKRALGRHDFVLLGGVGHFPCYEASAAVNFHLLNFVRAVQ